MKSINLLALPGATEFTPQDRLTRYAAERGVDEVLASTGRGALPTAQELLERTADAQQPEYKAHRVAQAMHGLLDKYTENATQLVGWHKENPTLHVHNVERPALVSALRAQAGLPIEGEERESWRVMLARYKRPGISSVMMHYTVYLDERRFMENGLDIGSLGDQIHAGNGLLADRQISNFPVNIVEVPGVVDAIIEDIDLIREQNGIVT
jgi:hypothetical protein